MLFSLSQTNSLWKEDAYPLHLHFIASDPTAKAPAGTSASSEEQEGPLKSREYQAQAE